MSFFLSITENWLTTFPSIVARNANNNNHDGDPKSEDTHGGLRSDFQSKNVGEVDRDNNWIYEITSRFSAPPLELSKSQASRLCEELSFGESKDVWTEQEDVIPDSEPERKAISYFYADDIHRVGDDQPNSVNDFDAPGKDTYLRAAKMMDHSISCPFALRTKLDNMATVLNIRRFCVKTMWLFGKKAWVLDDGTARYTVMVHAQDFELYRVIAPEKIVDGYWEKCDAGGNPLAMLFFRQIKSFSDNRSVAESVTVTENRDDTPAISSDEDFVSDVVKTFCDIHKGSNPFSMAKLEALIAAGGIYMSKGNLTKIFLGVCMALNFTCDFSIIEFVVSRACDCLKLFTTSPSELVDFGASIKRHKGLKDIKRAISYLIVPFASSVEWTFADVDIVSIAAAEEVSGEDFIEVISSIVQNVQRVIADYQSSGNLNSLLIEDTQYRDFMREYWSISQKVGEMKQGAKATEKYKELIVAGREVVNKGTRLRTVIKDRVASLQVARAVHAMAESVADMEARQKDGAEKRRPLIWSLGGYSQIGKTPIAAMLIRAFETGKGKRYESHLKATVTGTEKYPGTIIDESTRNVHMDDHENEILDNTTVDFLLRFGNNVNSSLEHSEANMKGKIYSEIEHMVITTNVFHMNAEKKTYCIASHWNRVTHVLVRLKESARNDRNTFNGKLLQDCISNGTMPDFWEFDIYETICEPSTKPFYIKDAPGKPIKQDDQECYFRLRKHPTTNKPMKGLSLQELLGVAIIDSKEHDIRETAIRDANEMECIEKFLDPENKCMKLPALSEVEDADSSGDEQKTEVNVAVSSPKEIAVQTDVSWPTSTKKKKQPKGKARAESVFKGWVEKAETRVLKEINSKDTTDDSIRAKEMIKIATNMDNPKVVYQRIKFTLIKISKAIAKSKVLHPAVWTPGINEEAAGSIDKIFCNTAHVMAGIKRSLISCWRTVRNLVFLGLFGGFAVLPIFVSELSDATSMSHWPTIKLPSWESVSPWFGLVGSVAGFACWKLIPIIVGGILLTHAFFFMVSNLATLLFSASWIALGFVRDIVNSFRQGYNDSCDKSLKQILKMRSKVSEIPSWLRSVIMLLSSGAAFSSRHKRTVAEAVYMPLRQQEPYMKQHEIYTRDCNGDHNHTQEEAHNLIASNVVTCQLKERNFSVKGIFIRSGQLLLPKHFLQGTKDGETLQVRRKESGNNAFFSVLLDSAQVVNHPTKDCAIFHICSRVSGGFKDIAHLFGDEYMPQLPTATRVQRVASGALLKEVVPVKGHSITSYENEATGEKINNMQTLEYIGTGSNGTCGATLVSNFAKPQIVGMHIAGDCDDKTCKYALCLVADDIRRMMTPPNGIAHINPPDHYGGDYSKQSCITHLPDREDFSFLELGKVGGHVTTKDNFVVYPTSSLLEDNGYPFKWAPSSQAMGPSTSVVSTQRWFEQVITPQGDVLRSLKNRAVDDYVSGFDLRDKHFRRLTRKEIIEGCAEFFIKSFEMGSSPGPGFKANTKSELAYKAPDGTVHLYPWVWREYEKFIAALRRGDFPLAKEQIIKVGKKVEARLLGKKQRMYQILCMFINMALRQYCGCVMGYLMEEKETSECFAKMDAHGKDWNDLYDYLHGKSNNVSCLDYSGFDQSIPSGILSCVFEVIIKIMQKTGYENEDLTIVETLFAFLLNPVINLDGDVYQVHDMMPSGVYCTSLLDGMITSILMRCCFFTKYPKGDFRTAVKLATCGDDAVFSVGRWYRLFTATFYRDFVKDLGMTVTSTDKDDNLVDNIPLREFTFISRTNRWCPKRKKNVGVLKEDSIVRGLHCGQKSKVVPEDEIIRSNVENSIREKSLCPQKEFDEWIQLLTKFPQEYTNHVQPFPRYDQMVDLWKADEKGESIIDGNGIKWRVRRKAIAESAPQDSKGYFASSENMESQEPSNVTPVPGDRTIGVEERAGLEIFEDTFCTRPIIIYQNQLTVATDLNTGVDVFSPFFKNKRFTNRINNWKNFSATAVIKVMLPAAPQFYGKYMISVYPLGRGNTYAFENSGDRYNIIASQLPSITISPGQSESAELEIPWFYYSEFADIPTGEYTGVMRLAIRSLTTLSYAGDVTGGSTITMTILAYLKDIMVQGLTYEPNLDLVAQAGEDEQATETGVVTRAASAAANIAGAVSGIHPKLDAIVEPLQLAAKVGAAIAPIFGLSRPNMLCEDIVYRNRNYGDFSTSAKGNQARKLTYDPKQNIGIGHMKMDPRRDDILDFKAVTNTRSYFTQFSVFESNGVGDTLFNMLVTPLLYDLDGDNHLFAACAAPTLFFDLWSGDIEITLEPIVNRFHKGNLLVQYDAYGSAGANPTEEVNVNYSKVIHLEEGVSFSFVITPSQSTPYMRVGDLKVPNGLRFSSTPLSVVNGNNAFFSVKMFTQLSAPEQTGIASIPVLVYARAIGDMKFGLPSDKAQSAVIAEAGEGERFNMPEEGVAPGEIEDALLATDKQSNDYLPLTYLGEDIRNFNVLLRRYTYFGQFVSPVMTATTLSGVFFNINNPPVYRGQPGPSPLLTDGGSVNLNSTPILSLVSWMYAAMRGSINWRFILSEFEETTILGFPKGVRPACNVAVDWNAGTVNQMTGLLSMTMSAGFSPRPPGRGKTGYKGIDIMCSQHNPSMDVTIPYHNEHLFGYTRAIPASGQPSLHDEFLNISIHMTSVNPQSTYTLDTYVSSGEDFSLLYFIGLPELKFD